MSANHSVTIKCDVCSKEQTITDGSYTVECWIKIHVELYNHSARTTQRSHRSSFDFCDTCVDKVGHNSLLLIAAKKAQK